MEYDENKIDEVILALLYLNTDKCGNTWKGVDWDSMDRSFWVASRMCAYLK